MTSINPTPINATDRAIADTVSVVLGEDISPGFIAVHRDHIERNAARVDHLSDKRRAQAVKLRKKYKRARRRLLELAVWSDPEQVMGVIPGNVRLVWPEGFDEELRKRAHAVAVAFDRYTECTVKFDPYIPKL